MTLPLHQVLHSSSPPMPAWPASASCGLPLERDPLEVVMLTRERERTSSGTGLFAGVHGLHEPLGCFRLGLELGVEPLQVMGRRGLLVPLPLGDDLPHERCELAQLELLGSCEERGPLDLRAVGAPPRRKKAPRARPLTVLERLSRFLDLLARRGEPLLSSMEIVHRLVVRKRAELAPEQERQACVLDLDEIVKGTTVVGVRLPELVAGAL